MSEFETALLGACLRSPNNLYIVIDGLRDEDFSSPKHQAIFGGIKSLLEKNAPVDKLSLLDELKVQGKEILASELIEIEDSFFDGFDIDYYKSQVKISSKRRNLQSFLSKAIETVQNASIEYSELEGRITQGVMTILDDGKEREQKTSEVLIRSIIDTYYRRKIEREEGQIVFGVPTGFESIDEMLGGFQDGTLGILAGRQNHGKSTVAMDILLSAIRQEVPSLYISLEQPSAEILLHLIQKLAGIKPLHIKTGALSPDEEKLLTSEIYSRFKSLPIFFEDQARTLHQVSMKIRRMALSHKVKFIVIDYLQLIENPLKGEARHIEVAMISRTLKRLAMELNIPILALSQLNKNPEERVSNRIFLSDMRESEAISQDADYVIFIHRPILMGKDDKDHLELAKNRYGETIPRITVEWNRRLNSYREMAANGR